jgi:ribosomal protein S18 acetylase RimI-like enzyme
VTTPGPASTLETHRLEPRWSEPLARFLAALRAAGDEAEFHPHPFSSEETERLARDSGPDRYYVVVDDHDAVVAYGMLRGWASYDVPSLGLAVHPARRGKGIAKMLMAFLHEEARREGASHIRLKVYPGNVSARRLYERLGYEFGDDTEDGQLVGRIQL